MSTRSRRRKREARIARDAKPRLTLVFPEGTPGFLVEAFRQIRWVLDYRIGRRADGTPFTEAFYSAPAPFEDLQIVDGQVITPADLDRVLIGYMKLATEAFHGTEARDRD